MESINECSLECNADASFANLSDCASQGGFIILLKESAGNSCPVFWQCREIRRAVKFTLTAETLAILECASEAVYIREVLMEICRCGPVLIRCYIDNKSLMDTLKFNKNVDDRRLRLHLAVLQDIMQKYDVNQMS